ncbi:MAG: NAD-dependent epimerase/dehydratase family protein [Acidobacteria bacterium]|nr:NAD-dependent epimerase/dehydratase family protein [Acidobacteriota bacterium]
MKVLVTGGSGYLGTHVRKFFGADDLSRRGGRDMLYQSDTEMVADYDLVIHLAARLDKSPDAAEDTFETNIEGTLNILKNVRTDAAFVFASTKDVYGRFAGNYSQVDETCPTLYSGQSPLEWSKLIAERYVEYYAHNRGFRSCIFRLSSVYAPPSEGNAPNFVGHFAEAINRGEAIRLPGAGRPIRDILHVDDLSRACEAFAGSVIRHGLYNLGGGRNNALTLSELVKKMEDLTGLQAVVDAENPLPDPVPMNYVTDLGLITRELDWKPEVSLDDGLKTLF